MTTPVSIRRAPTASTTELEARAEVAGETGRTDLPCRTLGVVRHPVEHQLVGILFQHRVASGRVPVPGLPHRPGDDEPAPEPAELDRRSRHWLERADRTVGGQVVEGGGMGVAGEDL